MDQQTEIKFKGNTPIRFASIGGFNGIVKPGDIIKVNSNTYENELKENINWELAVSNKPKKIKKEKTEEELI